MPTYDYRCLVCDRVFEKRTAMAVADDVSCPEGHSDVKRLMSVFAVSGKANPASSAAPSPAPSGGSCCGGGCGCG
ncbi:MAG: zinc ribbon domain-containing protein [Microthrixaceae bacterium]|nr:zinc ribbon domain-containing protein [Microthrixaceae bacterium]